MDEELLTVPDLTETKNVEECLNAMAAVEDFRSLSLAEAIDEVQALSRMQKNLDDLQDMMTYSILTTEDLATYFSAIREYFALQDGRLVLLVEPLVENAVQRKEHADDPASQDPDIAGMISQMISALQDDRVYIMQTAFLYPENHASFLRQLEMLNFRFPQESVSTADILMFSRKMYELHKSNLEAFAREQSNLAAEQFFRKEFSQEVFMTNVETRIADELGEAVRTSEPFNQIPAQYSRAILKRQAALFVLEIDELVRKKLREYTRPESVNKERFASRVERARRIKS